MLLQPLLLLLLVHCTLAHVYTCEEVKKALLNTAFKQKAMYACTRLAENYTDVEQLKKIFFEGHSGRYSKSRGSSLNFDTCLNMGTHYSVVSDNGENLDCSQKFALFFTNENAAAEKSLIRVYNKVDSVKYISDAGYATTKKSFISPNLGMWLRIEGCSISDPLELWTDIGEEELGSVKIRSWTCEEAPTWIVSFDIALTLKQKKSRPIFSMSSNMSIILSVAPKQRIFIYATAREGAAENIVRLQINGHYTNYRTPHYITLDADVLMDSSNNGSVDLLTSSDAEPISFRSGVNSTVFESLYFEVQYKPRRKRSDEFWKSDEKMFLNIVIGEEVPPPTTTTHAPSVKQAPYCNCEVDVEGFPIGWNHSEIWLDVVVILDTSEAMGEQGLRDASALVESFLSDGGSTEFLVTDPSAEFFTRIGVIGMSDTATILYNLNMTKDDRLEGKAKIKGGITEINVLEAFEAALLMFEEGLKTRPDRNNTRNVIYYITDSDPKNNYNPITQFKASKGVIIVNHFLQEGEVELAALKELASDGYYFINDKYDRALHSFCKANCHCKRERNALGGPDPAIIASGGCYHGASAGVPYRKAVATCALSDGILAAVHDEEKAEFVRAQMDRADSEFFWIGYEKAKGGDWKWTDKSTQHYTNWADGQPIDKASSLCAYVNTTSPTGEWFAGNCLAGFPYVCEHGPCSVGFKNC